MKTSNSSTILGNVGNKVDINRFDSGKVKASFSVATNEYWKNENGELQTETQWHNVEAWGKLAERMEKVVSEGVQILVEGPRKSRTYDDKDGVKKEFHFLKADDFQVFGKVKTEENSNDKKGKK